MGSRAVLVYLNDPEVPEAVEANLAVDVGVYAPSCGRAFLTEQPLLFFESLIFGWAACQVESSVEHGPICLIVGAFEVPVEHHVSGDVPVSDGVARWEELPSFAKIDAKVREWLVACSAVDDASANDVLWSA